MRRLLLPCLIILLLLGCTPAPPAPVTQALYAFRPDPPAAILQFSEDLETIAREYPLAMPPGCSVFNMFAPPRGAVLAIELSCAFGQTVVLLDAEAGTFSQAYTDADSHFLAWDAQGKSVYLKVDSFSGPHIVRVDVGGTQDSVPITEFTYDLSVAPDNKRFTFSFSRGLGLGSEMWLARGGGAVVSQLLADPDNYLSLARWSPDGKRIAFIKIRDSETPFTAGELWVMEAGPSLRSGQAASGAHFLAMADAGHGYAPAWSPDGKQIAFVLRENLLDATADLEAGALTSNIYIVDLESGQVRALTHLEGALVEAPAWSPDGHLLAFDLVLDSIISLRVADAATGEIRPIPARSACCPVWMRK